MLIAVPSDTKPVPTGRFTSLQLLEQRTVIERTTPSLFFSRAHCLQFSSPSSCIVLDCRAREHVTNRSYQSIVDRLNAVVMAEHIPPHQQCTSATRDAVKKWLQINCNLKHVFVMDAYPTKVSLHGNNMLTRVLKYLGLSSAKPIKVHLLGCGLHEAYKNKNCMGLLNVPAPVYTALVPKKDLSDGVYVFHHEYIKAPHALERAITDLQVKYVLNLTQTSSNLNGAKELGLTSLPLKNAKQTIMFITYAVEYLLSVPNGCNVMIIDTHLNKNASEVLVAFLILSTNMPFDQAIGVIRDRLNPPEFDSFARAAFMLLSETKGSAQSRMSVAFEQYVGRYEADHTLKSTTQLSLKDKWENITTFLQAYSILQYKPIVELVSKLCNNILMDPSNEKYRRIRITNPRISQVFRALPDFGPKLLDAGGWTAMEDGSGVYEFKGALQQLRDILIYMNSLI